MDILLFCSRGIMKHKFTMAGEEPPYLTVGTDVSAKYRGAFCEAKIKKVSRSVKCKVTFKDNSGTAIVTDDVIKGTLRVGVTVEAKHPDTGLYSESIINKLTDCSLYTVVFDDGDEKTLRRTALCLKGARHFAESETLDQLPLTNPEHFGTPVIGSGKKQRKRRSYDDDTSDEERPAKKKVSKEKEKDKDIGKVVCVDLGDKRKKDKWFPALVVSPSAQEGSKTKSKDEYLVRSFKDGKYHTPSKKETKDFTREIALRVDNSSLKTAVEKALIYLDKDELPPHWDRDLLMGNDTSDEESEEDSDSDSSDDEPSEEKDRFVAQLYKFMDDRGTPINKAPAIGARDLNLYKLFKTVQKMGGYNKVTNQMQWKSVYTKMGLPGYNTASSHSIKSAYKKYLHSFEDFYRKLGISMGTSSRPGRGRISSGRGLAYARDMNREFKVIHDRAKLKEKEKEKEKDMEKDNEKEKEKERDEEKDLPTNKSKDEEKRNFKSKDKDDEKSKITSRDDKGKNKDRNHPPTSSTTSDFNHNTAEKEESKDTKLSKRRTNMRSFTGRKFTKEEKKEADEGKKEKSKNDEDKDLKKDNKEVEMKLDKKDEIKDKKETDKKDKKQTDKKDKIGDKKNKKDVDKKDRKEIVKKESDKDKKIEPKFKKIEKKTEKKEIDKKEIEIKDKKEIDKKDKKDIEKKEVGKKDSDKKELGKKEIDKKDKKDLEKKEIDKKDKKEPIRKEFEKKDKKETPKKEIEKKDKKETPKKEIEKKETPKKEIEKKDKKDSPKKEIEKKDKKDTPKKEIEKKDKKETEKKVIEKKDKKEKKEVEKKDKKFEKKEIEKKGKKEMVKKEIGKKKIDKETEKFEIQKKEIEKEAEKKINIETEKTEIDKKDKKETKKNENGKKEIEQKEVETKDKKVSDKIETEKSDENENEKKEIVKKETEKKENEKKAKREVEKKDKKEIEKKSMKEIEKREVEKGLKEIEKKSLKETEKTEIDKNEIEKKDIKETEKKENETKEPENKEIENRELEKEILKKEQEKIIEVKESESKELDKIDEKKEEMEMIVLKELEKEDLKNDEDVDNNEKKSDGEKDDAKKVEYKDDKDRELVTKELDSDTDEASASDNEKESDSDARSDDDSDDDDDEFVVGSKVRVKYGRGRQQKIYEAKILEIEEQNGDVHFLVHYTGWNTRYDEWVRRQRVIECVDDKGSSRKRKKTSKTTHNKTSIKRGRPASTTTKSLSNNQISQGSSTSGPSKTKTSPIPQPVKSRTTRSDRNSLQDLPFVNGLDNKCPTARTRNRKSSGYTESSNDQSRVSDSDGNEDSDASELELMDQIQQESPELENSNSQKINKEEKIVSAEEEEKTMPALVSSEIKEKETKNETKMDSDKPEMELKIEEETISEMVEQKEEPKAELEKPTLTVSEEEIKLNIEEPKEDIKEVISEEPLQEENSQNSIEFLSPPVLIEEPVMETNFVPEPFFEEAAPAEELCANDEGYKESLTFSVEEVVKELQVVKQKMEIEQTVLRVLKEITKTKKKEEVEEERALIDFKKEENVRQDIKIIATNLKENVEAPVEKMTTEVNEPNQSLNYELEKTSKLELPQFNDISFLEDIPLLSVQEKVEKTDKLENIDLFPKHEIFKFQREKKSFLFRDSKREQRKLLEMKRDSLYDFTDDSSLEGTDSDLESMEISESTSSIINKLEKDEEEAMALLTSNIFKEIPEMMERNNDYRFKYEKPNEDKEELDQDKKKVKHKLIRDKKSPCEERISPYFYKDRCEERISPFEELQIDLKLEDKPSSSLFKLDKGGTKEKDKKKIKEVFHKQETEISIIDSTQVEKYLVTSQNPVLQPEPAILCLSASSPKPSIQLETAPLIAHNILNIPCSSNNNSSCYIPPPPTISLRHNSEVSAVLDNTPPTTPESTAHSASPLRESPSPQKDDDSNKSDKDSCDALPNILKVESAEDMSQADSAGTSSDTSVPSLEIIPGSIKRRRETDDQTPSIKKRKKTHHRKSSTEASKISNILCCGNNPSSSSSSLLAISNSSSSIIIHRQRHQSGKTGSDSDEMPSILESSANTDSSNNGSATNKEPLRQRSPRPSKFNFCIDPSLEGAERIAVLQDKLSELRKIYMSLKAEVACIDRRRKRAKRKEREAAAAASTTMEVQCA